jgi:hypothetical protein
VRNRIQAAETDISGAVLNESIYEPTSKPSSNRTPAKRSLIPLRAGESILTPFGYTDQKLAEIIKPTKQLTLPV